MNTAQRYAALHQDLASMTYSAARSFADPADPAYSPPHAISHQQMAAVYARSGMSLTAHARSGE